MADTIFVFSSPVEVSAIPLNGVTYDGALSLLGENLWGSSSRGGEYLAYVVRLLHDYPGFDRASYLTDELCVLRGEDLVQARKAIEGLVDAIKQNPAAYADSLRLSGEDVVRKIAEATESQFVDAEEGSHESSFFSFLKSQIAALDEALQSGRCLIYVRVRP